MQSHPTPGRLLHATCSRRVALQAGSIGLLGLGTNHLEALQAAPRQTGLDAAPVATSCIFIFLSGGLAQHDSFDMKPDAPDDVRGEFKPASTATPGLSICEHLPQLAARSKNWALCRSMTHPSNEHSQGHHMMLTGRTEMPSGFNPSKPRPADWPSIAAIAGDVLSSANNLPPAVVLPERLVHNSGRVIPGQFAGQMGVDRDPWFVEASPFHSKAYGAYPQYTFDHQERGVPDQRVFQAPNLTLPHGMLRERFQSRLSLLKRLAQQRRDLDQFASTADFDRYRQSAVSLLTDSKVHHALDVTKADEREQDRYGRHAFGWSLLMARKLVDVGVRLVQVNLGNNETWDTHGEAFPHLKDKLFPPTDQALSALLDDLAASGKLDETLIVVAGEFGRTPKITLLPRHYKLPGRDHWGASQTVLLAGAGIGGGAVIGSTDRIGAYPATDVQRPENLAATIYQRLGIPRTAAWYDDLERPHPIYHGDPLRF